MFQAVRPDIGGDSAFGGRRLQSARAADDGDAKRGCWRGFRLKPELGEGEEPELKRRLEAKKPARLELVAGAKGEKPRAGFAEKIRVLAEEFRQAGARRLAIVVNRVAAAKRVHLEAQKLGKSLLITGRMRPIDGDALTTRLEDEFAHRSRAEGRDAAPPVIVVATQCLEVGADFDFDAMICECASLSALRQRFGRLNRMGESSAQAAIVAYEPALKSKEPDPIYAEALPETWKWLDSLKNVDFGIAAIGDDGQLADTEFRTMRGAGHQHFLATMRAVLAETDASRFQRTLFTSWDYADPITNLSLRFDPNDDRRHAYQWRKPSGDPQRAKSGNMIAANALAVCGLSFYPLVPTPNNPRTVGFRGTNASNTFVNWPVWQGF